MIEWTEFAASLPQLVELTNIIDSWFVNNRYEYEYLI